MFVLIWQVSFFVTYLLQTFLK